MTPEQQQRLAEIRQTATGLNTRLTREEALFLFSIIDAQTELLREVLNSGVEHDAPRYKLLQVDKELINQIEVAVK